MTSMFDQFEQPSQNIRNDTLSAAEMSALGFIQMKEPDEPIFQKTKKNLTISDKVTHVVLSNKYLFVAMANSSSTLLRINLTNSQQEEISLTKYISNGRLSNLFLDPTGNHLLLTFIPNNTKDSPELYYLSKKSNKLKSTTKFRGHEFTEIGWNHYNISENTTGSILLGTSKGLIFETEIVLEGEKFFTSGFSSSLEQYWRQVFDIGKGTNTPITGLEFYQIPATEKYCIFASTPNSFYYFDGKANANEKPLLQQVFNKYLNVFEGDTCYKLDAKASKTRLKFWSEQPNEAPISFVWLTAKGIFYGKVEPFFKRDKKSVSDIFEEHSELIPFPRPSYVDMSVSPKFPINLVATQFHVLLAYSDTIKGISVLSKELVYEDNYNEAFGKLINIVRDSYTNNVWAITENHLFKFTITKEERHVWQFYSDKQEFDLAKKYSEDNEFHYNQVLIKEADMLFNQGKYNLSAERYAATQSSFEDICLKFIQVEQLDALKTFLCKKLDKLTPHDQAQTTMIVLCVAELFLDQLEHMRLQDQQQLPAYHELQKQFESFLMFKQVSDCVKMNKSSFYNLIASHGDKDNLTKLTIVNKDFEQLIKQHIYNNDYLEALNVLKGQNNIELYYQFTQILIQEVPKMMVKALIEQKRHLSPVRLLPAFVSCDQEHQCIQVIRYLEYCKDHLKTTEKAIHNLLLTLYAKYDQAKLMNYLDMQGQNILMVQYDVYFALRLCQEKNLTLACVQLSALLGLWESAVDLALTIDVKKAKEIANMSPQSETELRKKLWLKIAQFVISNKDENNDKKDGLNDIEKAMNLLQECDLLRIEDILPYFSDFETIDHFRNAICNSLKEYNQHIQDLKDEMDEATKSAELIRKEIQSFRNRYTLINHKDNCDICEKTLMVRPFYAFPCQHRFHTDCLLKELSPLLGPARKSKLADLHRQLNILNTQNVDSVSTGSTGISARDIVKAEIDNIVASECLYCGENMIRNIDMPFVDDNEYDRIMKEWE